MEKLITKINHVAAESLGRVFGVNDKVRIRTLIMNHVAVELDKSHDLSLRLQLRKELQFYGEGAK